VFVYSVGVLWPVVASRAYTIKSCQW